MDEAAWQGIYDDWVPFGGSVVRQIKEVKGKSLPAFAVFNVSTAQNNPYTKVAYFGCHVLNSYHHILGVADSAAGLDTTNQKEF